MRHLTFVTAALLAVTVASPALAAFKGVALLPQAKIKLAAARHTALAARPGTIRDEELEKEKGGSGLRYSFDVLSHGKIHEVGVDARTGAVLENGVDAKAD